MKIKRIRTKMARKTNPLQRNKRIRREGLFYAPFRIQRIMVENVGPIKKADMALKEINLIVGKNGSGKSILLNLIYDIGNHHPLGRKEIIARGKKSGKIRLELAENLNYLEYKFNKDSQNNEKYSANMKSKCFLVDDPFEHIPHYNPKAATKMLEYLKQFNSQIILTCRELPDIDLNNVNIIKI